jgi:hypothetical protein
MSADGPMEIVGVDFITGRELIVAFSDGTSTVYSVGQLMEIGPTKNVSANNGLFCEDVVKKTTKELAEWERDKPIAYTLASTVSSTLRRVLLTTVTELAIPNPAWENLRILRLNESVIRLNLLKAINAGNSDAERFHSQQLSEMEDKIRSANAALSV